MRATRWIDVLLARYPLATSLAVLMAVSLLGTIAIAFLGQRPRTESPSFLFRNESRSVVRLRWSDGSGAVRLRPGGSIEVEARSRGVRVTATFTSGSEPSVDVELPAIVVATPKEALVVVD